MAAAAAPPTDAVHVSDLPGDCLLNIAVFLGARELLCARAVSKEWGAALEMKLFSMG